MSNGKYVIVKGDKTSHGGTVLEGISPHPILNQPIACKGHLVSCPLCKGNYPIIEGVDNYLVDNKNPAVEGMKTACGATLIASQNVFLIGYTPPLNLNRSLLISPSYIKFISTDSFSNKIMPNTSYIAFIDGIKTTGVSDSKGIVEISGNNLNNASKIDFHFEHKSPKRTLTTDDIGSFEKDNCLVTNSNPDLIEKEKTININCNNRAATRQAIINIIKTKHQITVIERSNWNAIPPKGLLEDDWDYKGITIHHYGNSGSCDSNVSEVAKDVQNRHISNGYDDIGYHYIISCTGEISEARDIRYKGSHVKQNNTGLIGILLQGDYTERGESDIDSWSGFLDQFDFFSSGDVSEFQYKSLKNLCIVLLDLFNIEELGGHREFALLKDNRTCPGNIAMKRVEQLRRELSLKKPIRK